MKTEIEKSNNRNNKRMKKAEKTFQKASEKIDPELVLDVRNLTKIYPLGNFTVRALNNLSLKVKKGEFIAVVGPSGAGKTTLINCLGALDFPNEGKIIYNIDSKGTGMDITTMNDTEHKIMRLHRIGLIFQFYNLFPILTAYENVELPCLLAKKNSEESERKVKELLKMVGLDQRMYHLPTQMSGGEQQRVTIARSLVNEPLILLADEPTGELDTETTTQIIKIFIDLKNAGQSILMVTHNTRIAETADRILTLRDGEIIEERKGGRSIREIWYDSGGKIQ
jgi:putative ABC transport system ATP-binding protein